jgi:hypothetical protein
MSEHSGQKDHLSEVIQKALHEADAHNLEGASADPIPAPENGNHARSHAAHLGGHVDEHTKRAGNLRQGAAPAERREPPMIISRVGKDHRGQ